jgi:hypothetical protein
LDESSGSLDKNMSVDQMMVSTTDKDNGRSKKIADEMDGDKTYQSRIKSLGAITNEDDISQ